MPTLSKEFRRTLENTVADARRIAEAGAEQALKQLSVHQSEPWPGMTLEEKALRQNLRAHGKQLGDKRESNRGQEISRLKQACAYEHWHRMLFARFLAESNLLIHPDYREPISLDEVKELARAQNEDWLAIASSFAQRMLLEVFRADDPVLALTLPPETRQKLEELLAALPAEVFTAEDSLGWVYQFWQRDEKERVNKSEVDIGADELAPVTQLFTEDYMVLFLLHNTLGAWWTAKRRAEGKSNELSGYDWKYLRLNDDGSPTAGNFDGWPRRLSELRVLDPCMGSGHFLTFALPILAKMAEVEYALSPDQAVSSVLTHNLYGLELDARCSQIAAFNLAITAWRIIGRYVPLPPMNLACSGLGINAPKESWMALAGENGLLRDTLAELYATFQKAPTLGSLIDPTRIGRPLLFARFDQVWPLLQQALAVERHDVDDHELVVAAKGLLAAARTLAEQFTLVATNVPYLGRWRQSDDLANYCKDVHSDSKADLAACFIDRCIRFSRPGGTAAIVAKQEPLFLGQYKYQRVRLLKNTQWDFVAKLGPRAFEAISGERVNVALLSMTQVVPSIDHMFVGLDVSKEKSSGEKAIALTTAATAFVSQHQQLGNPDSRVIFEEQSTGSLLKDYASALAGHQVGDSVRFERYFWEVPVIGSQWEFLQSTVDQTRPYGGKSGIVLWEHERGQMYRLVQTVKHLNHVAQNWLRGKPNWGKRGVIVNQMSNLSATLYLGQIYDCNCCALVPCTEEDLPALWAYCSSAEFARDVRRLDQNIKVHPRTLIKVPFDSERWRAVASVAYSNELPKPFSSDPTQWLFDGHPMDSINPLQVGVARLVGYQWPRQTGSSFPDCPMLDCDGLEHHADPDGVVCLNSIAGAEPAAYRLRHLLEQAHGAEWSSSKLANLLGGTLSLEDWLRDKFFEEHCRLFQDRPFVWHVWDGRKDGFHAIVNYHKLASPDGEGRKTLEKLIYTTLGDWINRQRAEVASGVDGADGRLNASQHLQSELKKILEGEDPYDIFVRWKPIHEQPMGWEPDLNDGVRLALRPWLTATLAEHTKPKKGACILRITPKITYGKDRGEEPDRDSVDFPWSAESSDRNNDVHHSLYTKHVARERRRK
jgi:hypothetical protein